jgi:predicted amidohydrolase YtcJ
MTRVLMIRNAELGGRAGVDVRLRGDRIDAVGHGLTALPGEEMIDARGGALLPGLRDHHIHLMALAAAQHSVLCGPPHVRDVTELRRALEAANPAGDADAAVSENAGWIRGVGYHESVAGELDCNRLDDWLPGRAIRIQHRSGALWILSSAGLAALGVAEPEWPAGVERDGAGHPTGRIYRLDGWLRSRLPESAPPELTGVGQLLARAGVTAVTDASASNGPAELRRLGEATESGELPQRVRVMGGLDLPESEHPRIERGQYKIMLHEGALPELDTLSADVRAAHAEGRGVAFHCVTRSEAVLAATALWEAGGSPTDRIEHASIAPPDLVELLARLPLAIVSQPNFIHERGDRYQLDVDPRDRPWLYRGRGFLDAGLPLAGGTDAPYGDADPWRAMRAAVDRRSEHGTVLGADEALSPEEALGLFTSPLASPGRGAAQIIPGARADLCLLDRPWADARQALDAGAVRATVRDGALIWLADATRGDR